MSSGDANDEPSAKRPKKSRTPDVEEESKQKELCHTRLLITTSNGSGLNGKGFLDVDLKGDVEGTIHYQVDRFPVSLKYTILRPGVPIPGAPSDTVADGDALGTRKILLSQTTVCTRGPSEQRQVLSQSPTTSRGKKFLLRTLDKRAIRNHRSKIEQLEQALASNKDQLDKMTDDPSTQADDLAFGVLEQQKLKNSLSDAKDPENLAMVEVENATVHYVLRPGSSVVADKLPGCPRITWIMKEGDSLMQPRVETRQETYKTPYGTGSLPRQTDASQLELKQTITIDPRHLGDISGIAAGKNRAFVADYGKCQIVCISEEGRSSVWVNLASLSHASLQPFGMDLDEEHVYVSTNRGLFILHKADGQLWRSMEEGMNHPCGVAVGKQFIVVANLNGLPMVFDKNSGKLLRHLGDGTIVSSPVDVAMDNADKVVFVTDQDKHKVLAFDVTSGRFLFELGAGMGTGWGQMLHPCGVAVDEEYVYVCDAGNSRLQIFSKEDGSYLRAVTLGPSSRPNYISVCGDQIYVTDSNSDTVVLLSD